MAHQSFFAELRRRHVFRVAIAYAVTAWLLLQLAAIVLPTFNAPHWVLKVLIGVFVVCFPLAILLAWAFEVTPEGVRRTVPGEEKQARPASYARRIGQMLNVTIIVALAAAVGVLAWRQFGVPAAGTASSARSIAVLPFENLSTDQSNAYFADGMQDLILSKLAEIGGLTVISRTSTMRYQSHPEDLKLIGRQLGVSNLLEGSVQKAGDQVLINVQLINARTDHHLWAHSYQRTLENIFGVEGEVAERVAAALKAKLDPAERARVASVPTRNSAAYDEYLRGVSIEANVSDISGIPLGTVAYHFEQAVKLDPDFALAWANLASVDSDMSFTTIDQVRLERAKTALEHAITLAPDAAATQIAKGNYAYYGHLNYAKALAAYRKALEISPNSAVALLNIGFVQRRQGHWQTAIESMVRSLALDPRNVNSLSNLALSYRALHEYTKAKDLLRRALAISPGNPVVTASLADLYQSEGDLAQAGKVLARVHISPSNYIHSFSALIQQALLTRRYGDAVHLAQKGLATPNLSIAAEVTYDDWLGKSEQLIGNQQAARDAYGQAAAILKRVLPSLDVHLPRFAFAIISLANAQAGLGEKAQALSSARRAIALLPPSRDAFDGPITGYILASVQAQLGEKVQAIATLKRLLVMPLGSSISNFLTPALLRLDPTWDPLRHDPAFRALLKEKPIPAPSATSAD